MDTLNIITTNLAGILDDIRNVVAKVVVASVRTVTGPFTCWPFHHQGMRAYAMQPVRLRAQGSSSPGPRKRPIKPAYAEWPAYGAERGAEPLAAR